MSAGLTLQEELAAVDLGDRRLNRRACQVLEQLGRNPQQSIPTAIRGWTETKAAYHLFAHEQVTAQKILEPHYQATFKRIQDYPIVLCAQDTTELDYTGKNDIEGLGPLNYAHRKGLYLHPTLAITPERLALGQLDSWSWTRPFEDAETESIRWIEGYQRVSEYQQQLQAAGAPTQLVYLADREGDIYALFAEREHLVQRGEQAADWLIRSRSDRNTQTGEKLHRLLQHAARLGDIEFDLPKGRNGRKARRVTQTLRVVKVPLSPPQKGQPVLEITAILADEEQPPAGQDPIRWILLTNLDVHSLDEAKEKLDWYLCRWQIEIDQPWCLLKSLFTLVKRLNNLFQPTSWRIAQLA